MATTKRQLTIQKIESIQLNVEKIEVLNSFKRKSKLTKVSLFLTIKEVIQQLDELKKQI